VVAAEFDDALLLRSGQTVLSEDGSVSLTALTGTVSENSVERRSVDVRAVSASDTLPSRSSPITDRSRLNSRRQLRIPPRSRPGGRNERLPAGATAAADEANGTVRITLANGSDPSNPYRLGLSEISLDTTGTTEPAYIVPVDSESAVLGEQVLVEVRDRYNNPVPDATVSFDGVNRTTDDDGQAAFEPTGTGSLTATINGTVGPAYESVVFDVSESGGGAPTNRTFDVEWDESDPATIEEGTSESLDILVSDSTSGERIDGAAVDVSFAPRGTVNGPPSISNPPVTDSDGRSDDGFRSVPTMLRQATRLTCTRLPVTTWTGLSSTLFP